MSQLFKGSPEWFSSGFPFAAADHGGNFPPPPPPKKKKKERINE